MRQLKIQKQITNRENASLDKYLQEIARVELISAEEEVALAIRIKEGDQLALEKLTKANLRFVVSVAKQYQNQGLGLGDLISEGNLGLIKAAQRFDQTRGFKFISYAVWWIRQSIMQAIAEHARLVRLPLNRIGSINKINRVLRDLEQEFEREPTAEEIGAQLDMTAEEVIHALSLKTRHISVDAPIGESEEGTLLDVMISEDDITPDDDLMRDSLKVEVERALNTLTHKEREVVSYFFGLNCHGTLTLEEIGHQMGLTRERVRQIKEKAVRRLRHTNRSKTLRPYLG
jgi:RNA polymerase primary sigma factor